MEAFRVEKLIRLGGLGVRSLMGLLGSVVKRLTGLGVLGVRAFGASRFWSLGI